MLSQQRAQQAVRSRAEVHPRVCTRQADWERPTLTQTQKSAHEAAGACAEGESTAVVCFCAHLSHSPPGLSAEAPQGPR